MYGCLGIIALPILLLLCVTLAGFAGGFMLFLAVAAAGIIGVMNSNPGSAEMVEDAIGAIPVLGALYTRFIKPVTYYSEDSRLIFEEAVHRVVLKHVETLTTISKLPPLHRRPEKTADETDAPVSAVEVLAR
jgi:hypothetical protein